MLSVPKWKQWGSERIRQGDTAMTQTTTAHSKVKWRYQYRRFCERPLAWPHKRKRSVKRDYISTTGTSLALRENRQRWSIWSKVSFRKVYRLSSRRQAVLESHLRSSIWRSRSHYSEGMTLLKSRRLLLGVVLQRAGKSYSSPQKIQPTPSIVVSLRYLRRTKSK